MLFKTSCKTGQRVEFMALKELSKEQQRSWATVELRDRVGPQRSTEAELGHRGAQRQSWATKEHKDRVGPQRSTETGLGHSGAQRQSWATKGKMAVYSHSSASEISLDMGEYQEFTPTQTPTKTRPGTAFSLYSLGQLYPILFLIRSISSPDGANAVLAQRWSRFGPS